MKAIICDGKLMKKLLMAAKLVETYPNDIGAMRIFDFYLTKFLKSL